MLDTASNMGGNDENDQEVWLLISRQTFSRFFCSLGFNDNSIDLRWSAYNERFGQR